MIKLKISVIVNNQNNTPDVVPNWRIINSSVAINIRTLIVLAILVLFCIQVSNFFKLLNSIFFEVLYLKNNPIKINKKLLVIILLLLAKQL